MRRTGRKRRSRPSGTAGRAGKLKSRKGRPLRRKLLRGKRAASTRRRVLKAKRPVTRTSGKLLRLNLAEEAGKQAARVFGEFPDIYRLNEAWNASPFAGRFAAMNSDDYLRAAKRFLTGYEQEIGRALPNWVLLPTVRTIGLIITVMNEEDTLAMVLDEMNRLPITERIIVVNGSHDQSFVKARERNDTIVVNFPDKLGHDVGRGVGARMSQADILLFIDGDIVIQAEELAPFIHQLTKGADIVLNDITPLLPPFSQRDDVTVMKQFLNHVIGKPQLHANSLTAIPHAMTRKAAETIGYANLVVPPKAQWLAVHQGLKVTAARCVDVINGNRVRAGNAGRGSKVADLIVGDHLEALALAMNDRGGRLNFLDSARKREYAGGLS